jgi:predicted dehydrogenase
MTQTIRIGFVGAGGIVKTRHFPNLQNISDLELISVCNSTMDSSERTVDELGLQKVFADWRELVNDDDIDAVWIGTWPYMHCPITLEALKAGKHVFCQARMAMNLAEARKMRDAARQTDRVTMLCPPPMGLKGDYVMRDLLADNALGEIYSIHFRDINAMFIDPSNRIHWRQKEELSGFNTLTVGIYAEVIQRWFGCAKNVTAQAKTFIKERPASEGGTAPVTRPDVVLALSEMENGALMRWEWSALASHQPISVLEVFGSQGALCYDFVEDQIIMSQNGGDWELIPIPPEKERLWTVEQDFIDAIRDGKEVHPDFEDGVKYMEFTEAIVRSVEKGGSVNMPI